MSLLENVFASLTRTPPRGGIEAQVEAELVRIAYRGAGFGVLINVVVPVVVAAVVWHDYSQVMLVTWASLMAVVSLSRHLLHRAYLKVPSRPLEQLPSWTHAFRLGALLIGLLWGAGAWVFLGGAESVHLIFVVFIVTGLMAGAARSLAPIPFCFTPYAVLGLTPIVIRSLQSPQEGGWAMALMTVVYIIFLSLTARQQRAEMVRMYRTAIENEALMTDLREAKQRAEVANRAKGEFLSSISHEIHTPMHGVMGMLQLLETADLPHEQRVQVDVAMSSANALHGLLKDVLDFSRIESGRMEMAQSAFSLPDLVREASAQLAALADAKPAARLQLSYPQTDGLPSLVIGDPARLKQVLGNLLSNAVKFTDAGRIDFLTTVMVQKQDMAVVRFTVRDTGIGMTEDTLSKAFEKFTQGNGTMTRRHGGIGLGLAIAQQLVWRMGGDIQVKTRPGEGSDFWFELPFQRATLASAEPEPTSETLEVQERLEGKVLVVEDDRASRQVVEMMLRRWHVDVRCVGSAEEALAVIPKWQPAVVLMDIRLPGADGMSATRQIRQLALRVAIVALTANTSPQDRSDCIEAGMDCFLTKPVKAPDLHRVLARWIRADRKNPAPEGAGFEMGNKSRV